MRGELEEWDLRFGYCLNMVARRPDKTGMENLDTLAELGYDYVELPCAELSYLPEEEIRSLKARLSDLNLPMETSNNFFPPATRLTGTDVRNGDVDAYARRALDRLAYLGTKIVVFGSGGAKNVPDGFALEAGYAQVVDLLQRLAPEAGARGITIAIEPLRAVECNLINTFEEGVRLAEDVRRDNVRVLVDYYHLREMDEPVSHIEQYGSAMLRHVHFARQAGRTCPADCGEDAEYAPFFAALRAAGYEARISCEAYSDNFKEDAGKALSFFRQMSM